MKVVWFFQRSQQYTYLLCLYTKITAYTIIDSHWLFKRRTSVIKGVDAWPRVNLRPKTSIETDVHRAQGWKRDYFKKEMPWRSTRTSLYSIGRKKSVWLSDYNISWLSCSPWWPRVRWAYHINLSSWSWTSYLSPSPALSWSSPLSWPSWSPWSLSYLEYYNHHSNYLYLDHHDHDGDYLYLDNHDQHGVHQWTRENRCVTAISCKRCQFPRSHSQLNNRSSHLYLETQLSTINILTSLLLILLTWLLAS